MDPDAALEEIRSLLKEYTNADNPDALDLVDLLDALTTEVEALDKWISDGGFLPAPWRV